MSTRPALVIVTSSFPISGDGSEAAGAFVADLAEELAQHVPVRVVAPGRADGTEHWSDNVDVFRYAAPAQALSTLKLWHPGDLRAICRVLAAGLDATRRAVAVDVPAAHILALWALPCGHWARCVSAETGLPYSVWTLGSDIWSLGKIPVVRGHLRRVLGDASHCFADGLRLAEDTRAIGGRPVEFLPSSRRIGRTRTSPARHSPPFRLAYLGRWHLNKGVDLLIAALRELDERTWWQIESVKIHGGGVLEPLLRRQVTELQGMGRPVELGGYLTKADAEEALLQADYLVIPSRQESIPVVLSDALKLRCPVICTPVGDMGEIVSRYRAGIVTNRAGVEAIRKAVSEAVLGAHVFADTALDEAAAVFDLQRIAGRVLQLVEGGQA